MQTRRQTKEAAATASAQVYHHHISQTPSANAIAAQGVQSLTTFHSTSGYGSQHTNDSENDNNDNNNEPQIYKVFEYDENDKGIFEVNIDFDGASEAWKENKKSSGNGCYKYRCIAFVAKTGIKCEKFSKSGCDYCAMHNKK